MISFLPFFWDLVGSSISWRGRDFVSSVFWAEVLWGRGDVFFCFWGICRPGHNKHMSGSDSLPFFRGT